MTLSLLPPGNEGWIPFTEQCPVHNQEIWIWAYGQSHAMTWRRGIVLDFMIAWKPRHTSARKDKENI
jgi:hypothetical protein